MSVPPQPKKKYADAGKIYARDHPEFTGKFSELRIKNKTDAGVIAAIEEFKSVTIEYDEQLRLWRLANPEAALKADEAKEQQRKRKRIRAVPALPGESGTGETPVCESPGKKPVVNRAKKAKHAATSTSNEKQGSLQKLCQISDYEHLKEIEEAIGASNLMQDMLKAEARQISESAEQFMEEMVTKFESLSKRLQRTESKISRCAGLQQDIVNKIEDIAHVLLINYKSRSGEEEECTMVTK